MYVIFYDSTQSLTEVMILGAKFRVNNFIDQWPNCSDGHDGVQMNG